MVEALFPEASSRALPSDSTTPASSLAVFALTERVPEWAQSFDPALPVDEWLAASLASKNECVVLVDAALLDGNPEWVARVQRDLGPLIAIAPSPGASSRARALGARATVPPSVLEAPRSVAMEVLNDALAGPTVDADRMERFMRDAIHEFRTPLTVISEFVGLCEDGIGGPLTERQRTYLGYIQGAVDRMAEQFDDYRDGLRMRMGSLEHTPSNDPIDSVLRAAFDHMGFALGSSDVDAPGELSSDEFAPGMVLHGVDSARAIEALKRILAGARKLSSPSEALDITVEALESRVIVRVAFTGTEPSAEDVAVIDQGTTMRDDGFYRSVARVFGLGVSMARMFLLQSGGKLRLETSPGFGGAYVVELPARAGAERRLAA